MRQVPKLNIFIAIMSAELGANILTPLLAFLFFATDSPLFSDPTNIAKRSFLFGTALCLYKLAEIIANMLITTFSDHFGRKLALYGSFFGLLILSLTGMLALNYHSPLLMICGLFFSNLLNTNKAVGPSIMGDLSDSHNRLANMATIQSIIALGACLGPLLGGQLGNHPFLLQIAYSLPFIIISGIAFFGLALTQKCPETLPSAQTAFNFTFKKMINDYKLLLCSKPIRVLFLLLIFCQMSWSCYYEFIPAILKNVFHYSPSLLGLFIGLVAFWLILASSVLIRILLKFFNHTQLLWGSVVAILSGSLLSLLAIYDPTYLLSSSLIWLSAIPMAMGDVIFFSLFTTFLSSQVAADQQGKAMGLTLIIASAVWSIMALLGGYLLGISATAILLCIPLGAIILLFILANFSQSLYFEQSLRTET